MIFKKLLKPKKKTQPFYDERDAVDFIVKKTGFSKRLIRTVLNAELLYEESVGIIDWPDLGELIEALDKDSYYDN